MAAEGDRGNCDLVEEMDQTCNWSASRRGSVAKTDRLGEEQRASGKPVEFVVGNTKGRTAMKRGHLGVDLHGNCFTVYPRAEDGSGEGSMSQRLFRQALRERGCRMVGVNPHPFAGISRSAKKTDEPERQVLPEERMKDEVHARVASLAQRRDQRVKGRTVLVPCALIAARSSPFLQRFYRRIVAVRGTGQAIIALARKFLGLLSKRRKHTGIFDDFPRFVLVNG